MESQEYVDHVYWYYSVWNCRLCFHRKADTSERASQKKTPGY